MIEVENLRKVYGELVAVDGVSLRAEPGTVFGLLGPNGAGKSTTIGCISGLLRPTSGRARVCGHDVVEEPAAAKAGLGVVPQELALYEALTARQNLAYWGGAYGLGGAGLERRIDAVLELVGLLDRDREAVGNFSGGMKRRLNFGCGIVHEPRVLLLDEPTAGVDPQSRVRLLDLVRRQVDDGTCVLYTTHYMEEAQELCDRIAIIDHGRILAVGTLEELRGMMGERDVLRLSGTFAPERVHAALDGSAAGSGIGDVEILSAAEDALMLALENASRKLPAIFDAVEAAGGEIHETTLTQPSLESLFIELTGRELRE